MNIEQPDIEIWCGKHAPANSQELYNFLETDQNVPCIIPLCEAPAYWCTHASFQKDETNTDKLYENFSKEIESVRIHEIKIEYKLKFMIVTLNFEADNNLPDAVHRRLLQLLLSVHTLCALEVRKDKRLVIMKLAH